MGEAARKAKVRDTTLENAAVLINRNRATEVAPVEAFNRDDYDCAVDHCWVRRDPEKEIGAGQVISGKKVLPDTGTVEVTAIGWLKPGDKVFFSKNGGMDIQVGDALLIHLHELQVYGIRKKQAAL